MKALPYLLTAIALLFSAWRFSPCLIWLSLAACVVALYKLCLIRCRRFLISGEFIRVTTGILFKRTDQLEMFRIKDFIVTQSLLFQIFKLMDLTLITTDATSKICRLTGIPASDLLDTIRMRVQDARKNNAIWEIVD
ncbi:PH domain-containing protein [Mucilaginibacter rubeus]|uniref:PH domain-containing protein n=1 Tax=Mucilaginibacter rubeus TaxID=2027860 RepID=UPI001669EB27|nr:PH domain-containing protein [Mucilaginibacter rubeus]